MENIEEEGKDQETKPYQYRKNVTIRRLISSIDLSLGLVNYGPVIYLNREGNFQALYEYEGPKSSEAKEGITWVSYCPEDDKGQVM